MDETSQAIGALQAEVAILQRQVSVLTSQVTELLAVINASKGSWRTIVAFGAVATSLGAGAATLLSFFKS
jgi:prefoldin subunit 5